MYFTLITTYGYERSDATGLFETGMKRFCEYSKLPYLGMLPMRDGGEDDWKAPFLTAATKQNAEAFARKIMKSLE